MSAQLAMFDLNWGELILIGVVALVAIGPGLGPRLQMKLMAPVGRPGFFRMHRPGYFSLVAGLSIKGGYRRTVMTKTERNTYRI
jgi:hypothetical protein